jgi:hypothetical protein
MKTKKTLYGVKMTLHGEDGDGGRYIHAEGSGLLSHMTLCGFVDVRGYQAVPIKSPSGITCPGCLSVLRVAKPYLK